jgi:hypothetical protein
LLSVRNIHGRWPAVEWSLRTWRFHSASTTRCVFPYSCFRWCFGYLNEMQIICS